MLVNKQNCSYLLAFARQIAAALEDDSDDDIAIALSSLATSLELLKLQHGEPGGLDDAGLPESVDDDDAPGDDTPLGAALARIAELERGAPAAVDVTRRRLVGGGAVTRAGEQDTPLPMARQRRQSPVLKRSKRRGKK